MKKEVNQADQSLSETGGCPAGSSVCRNPVHYSGGGGPSTNPTCHVNSPWPAECIEFKPKDEEIEPPN